MNSKRPFFLLILLICVSLPISCRSATAPAKMDPKGAMVDELVREEMDKSHVPGLVLVVVKDGKITKFQAYGLANIESKAPASADTVFALASISKQFVATAIMMLVEEGKLCLDDSISKYLDGTPGTWQKITIRHLLTNTSGIPDFINESIDVDIEPDTFEQSVLDALAKCSLHFSPGDDWSYSNSNFHLLGMIIHKITGKPYGDFLHERIFMPLGMTHTVVSPMSGEVPGLAVGYNWNKDSVQPQDPVPPAYRSFAGGGLLSTVPDMIKWDAALRTGKLLNKSILQQMWTPVRLNDGGTYGYGFGWFTTRYVDHLVVEHSGNYAGYSSVIYRCVDDHITVIILNNQSNFRPPAFAKKIAMIYGLMDYKPIPDKDPKITAHLRDIINRSYKGASRAEDFTPAVWAKWSLAQELTKQKLADMGPMRSMALVERTNKNGNRAFRYRIEFKTITLYALVAFDKQNKIASIDVDM